MNVKRVMKSARVYTALLAVVALCLMLVPTVSAGGFDYTMQDGAAAAKGISQTSDLFGQAGTFRTITNVMLYLIGAISVIMLIIGGLRYVVSGGDSTAVQNAKNTILYAIVGIIVAILAYSVVSFVITSFSTTTTGTASGTVAPTNT